MVDLSKAKSGQIVHFRCGGSAKILSLEALPSIRFSIRFEGQVNHNENYTHSGLHNQFGGSHPSPFDIIRLEDPPFDWKDVKSGIAFKIDGISEINYYIGKSALAPKVLFETLSGMLIFYPDDGIFLRSPEHDKAVK